MHIAMATLAALTASTLHGAPAAQASWSAPWTPQVGDSRTYSVSTGARVTLRTLSVRRSADRVVASEQESIERSGIPVRQLGLQVIRTPHELAFGFPSCPSTMLSPLVFYFSRARVHDSWLAQRVRFLGASGQDIAYHVIARVEGLADISAPAGRFPGCWRLRFTSSARPGDRLTVWLRPDLGIVRTQSRYQGRTIVTELMALHLADGLSLPISSGEDIQSNWTRRPTGSRP